MTILTVDQLKVMCKGKPGKTQLANMSTYANVINQYGSNFGLNKLYNLASQIGQVMLESGEFRYDKEIWGPTAQQKKYEPGTQLAKNLGNTNKGDGSLFRGYGLIQLTGRGNVTRFHKWVLSVRTMLKFQTVPDFTRNPAAIATDPWKAISVLWYWGYGNPSGRSLNKYAEDNNQLMVTRLVNGGTTHYAERLEYQTRAALVLLGYGVTRDEIKRFQSDHSNVAGDIDGVIGDKTRSALHLAMKGKLPVTSKEVKTVETIVESPVIVDNYHKPWYKDADGLIQAGGGAAVTGAVSFLTDADVEKIIVVALIAAIAFAVWYFIRKSKAREQDILVDKVLHREPRTFTHTTVVQE